MSANGCAAWRGAPGSFSNSSSVRKTTGCPRTIFRKRRVGLPIVHSTSPTDLGLLLLSTLAAYDLGYIGLWDLSARLRDTFESMEQLETYRGHFLNW